MSTLILSPAASGKTAYIIERIRQVKAANPLAPVLVVAPNQLQAAAFGRRLAEAGGALGVEVQTFHGLYAELLARAGQPYPALLDPLQVRLLRAIVDDLCERGAMRYYAALRRRPGFVLALRSAIQELKRARVFPETFAAAVQGLGPNLTELSQVYTAYQDWLQRENWADLEGRGWLAAIALEQHPELGADLQLLAVVGFDEFNPTQLGVLGLLAPRAAQTLVTLTGSLEAPQRLAHRRFRRARQALEQCLGLQVESLPPSTRLSPPLAHLEAQLFETPPVECAGQGTIEFIEAQTRPAEARAALRWVKARLVRDGLGLADVAILAYDLEPYRPFLEETAAEFGVPLRVVSGLPLAQNPAVAALLQLLALPVRDWPQRQVVEAWRCPYFDWSGLEISLADAAALDAAARQGRVTASLARWREAFDLLENQALPANPEDLDLEDGAGGLAIDQQLRRKFEAFCARLTPPAAGFAHEYVAFIEDLVGDDPALSAHLAFQHEDPDDRGLGMIVQARAGQATAERDVAALRAFKDVLRGLVLAEAALNTPAQEYAAFIAELHGAVEAAVYQLPAANGVLAATVLNARGLSFQAVALLGLSEGEFPRPEREDPFLSEADRAELRRGGIPLESRLSGDGVSIFYQAVTRARQRLLLTRPYLADDGQPWESSPYWEQAHRLAGRPQVWRVRPEDRVPPEEAASAVEYPLDPAWIQRGRAVLEARLAWPAAGAHEGQLPELAGTLARRYGAAFGWSASKLEAYGACPFFFYVAYALGLEVRTPAEDGYDVRILGSMLHKILEDTYAGAQDPGSLEECLERMEALAPQVFAAAPTDYGFRPTPLWVQQQDELKRTLRKTITALADQAHGFTPHFFEQKFGMGNPALVLASEIGAIRLHGYIDRIDRAADGRLRVVDYKSGGAPISARHLEQGRRLQLPLYALAAERALGLGEVAGGFYWHIQQAKPSSLNLEAYDGGVQAALETAAAHVTGHVGNIRAGQFQPAPPADGCPTYCPAASFCWRYQPKSF